MVSTVEAGGGGGQRRSNRFPRSHRSDHVFISNLIMSSFTYCSRIPAGFGSAKPDQLFP